ncbi:MAG: ATP-grasp domain-containing protein [Candidatus Hodarchaeota archaeon]
MVDTGSHKMYAAGFYSKFCRNNFLYPHPSKTNVFISFLLKLIKNNEYDILLPVGYDTTIGISMFKDAFLPHVKLPIADYDKLRVAANKSETLKLAEKIGIPCPKIFHPQNFREISEMAEKLQYPVVVKGITESGEVRYVNSPRELIQEHERMSKTLLREEEFPIIQEYIPGVGYGFFALFNQGKVKALFMHRRVREYPATGGPSTSAESVYEPKLMEYGLRMLRELKWHGVAMVEFKRDTRDGEFKLMEVNPKFWGSLDLAIASGVDFPFLACKMAVDGDIEPVLTYKFGVRFNWPLPDEFKHFVSKPTSIKEIIKDLLNKNMNHNIDFHDLKPNTIQLLEMMYYLIRNYGSMRFPHGKPV